MMKLLGAFLMVLSLSLFGSTALSAFADSSPTTVTEGGDKDKKKKGKKKGKKGKKKKHGKKGKKAAKKEHKKKKHDKK